jgi:Rieske Fe-S protein
MAYSTTRREVIRKLSGIALGIFPLIPVLTGCATTGLALYRGVRTGRTVSLDLLEFRELLEDGGGIQLDVEDFVGPIVVVRLNFEEFAALSPICTHLGCTVKKERSFFRCPCHGSTYTLNGEVVRGPAKQRLSFFQTERIGDQLRIHL